MTLFLVLEDVSAGKYSLDSKAVATADAYRCEPSWIGIKVGESMSVRDLCLALMVESANDAAIVPSSTPRNDTPSMPPIPVEMRPSPPMSRTSAYLAGE